MDIPESEQYIGSLAVAMRDANEEESGLCNSLNAEWGWCKGVVGAAKFKGENYCYIKTDHLDAIADYLLRAQTVINYLRDKD